MWNWRSVVCQSSESHQRHSSHFFSMPVRPAILWKEHDLILLNSLPTAMNMPDMTQLFVFCLLSLFCIVLFMLLIFVVFYNYLCNVDITLILYDSSGNTGYVLLCYVMVIDARRQTYKSRLTVIRTCMNIQLVIISTAVIIIIIIIIITRLTD